MTPSAPPARAAWHPARLLVIIAAICFFLAAITAAGSSVLGAPAWAWGFGGFCAWALSWAVP